jgi:hypothetical protein
MCWRAGGRRDARGFPSRAQRCGTSVLGSDVRMSKALTYFQRSPRATWSCPKDPAEADGGEFTRHRSRCLGRDGDLTATTNPQFATGPQKCVVLGPVGENSHARNADAILMCRWEASLQLTTPCFCWLRAVCLRAAPTKRLAPLGSHGTTQNCRGDSGQKCVGGAWTPCHEMKGVLAGGGRMEV